MERNRYADLLRVVAIGGVVYGHWLLISVTYRDGRLSGLDALQGRQLPLGRHSRQQVGPVDQHPRRPPVSADDDGDADPAVLDVGLGGRLVRR